ncbi:MAG TPA: class I SAM-dependent methyltransferase, partial [Candidatus Omnitrophota bacterium]|nr:class I SAM-dependent methyltransferase [Candidatus Omnitrophota bacterium]
MPAAGIEINVESEAPGFLSVDIPSELATLDELYQAPPVSEPRLVLHIQNAHANYGAQQKVKELLKYLNKTYSIDTIFVEGASSELDPDRLKYFPDDERNRLLADQLAKDGRLTGAELFLLEDSYEVRGKEYGEKSGNTASVKAYGIENAELYRKNYEALRKVFGAEAVASRYVNELDARLETISSGISGNDLRRVIGEWKKFEKGQREFMPYIRSLAREANQTLKLDLESLFAQVEWPQIARLLVLQDIEKELSPARAAAEKEKLLGFLRSKSLPAELIRDIENLKDQNISVAGKNPANGAVSVQPRFLLEKLAGAAGPYGFRFSDYPAYSAHAGYLILRSELDSGALFAEIRRLFMQILEKLAASPAQRKLVELNRRTELIRKLLNLELARRDWQEIEAKKDAVAIDAMIRDFRALSDAVSTELRLAAPVLSGMDADPAFRSRIDSLYEAAYAFYAHAHEREAVFYEKIDAVMSARGERAAVLITGGFHTGGITDLFRDHDVSYGVLTPRLMEKSDEKAYRDNMLERGATVFDIANLEAFNIMQDDDVIRSQIGPEGLKAFQKYLTSTLVKILARHPQHLARAIKAISERSFREHGIRWVEKRNGKDSVVVLEKVGKNEEDVEEITNITDKDGKVYALRFSPLENGKYAMRAALMDPVSVTPALAAQAPTAQTPVGSRAGARPESDQKQDVGTRPESRRDVEVNQASVQSGPKTLQVMNVRVGPWVLPAFASKFIRSVFDRLAMWGVGPNISEGAGYYRGVAGNYGIDLDDEIAKRVAALDGARPLRVLDLGAGTAGYLQRLKDRYGDRVEAIAVDSSYPEQKRTRRGVKMIGKDAPDAVREFRERGEEFDVVLSINANSAAREFLLGSGPVLLNSNSLVFVHGADFLNEDHISSLEKQGYSVANGGTVTRKTPPSAAAKQPGSRSEMRVPLPVPDELVLDEKPDFDAWMNRLGGRGIRPAEPVIAITAKLFSARKVLPYRDFEQRLRDLEPKLIDALRNAGSYAVLLHKPHTSRRWVLSHLRVGAPDGVRAPGGLFYEGESEDHLKKASRFMTFVVVDDVAYS